MQDVDTMVDDDVVDDDVVDDVAIDDGQAARRVRFQDEVVAALDRERDPALAGLDDAALEHQLRVQAAEVAGATCRWLLLAEAGRDGASPAGRPLRARLRPACLAAAPGRRPQHRRPSR